MPILNIIAGAASLGLQTSATLVTGADSIPIWSGSLTNGQLLIGSTGAAPVVASLTAGTGISITPGAGSISIAVTGGAAVTSVTATAPLTSTGGTTPVIAMNGIAALAQGDLLYGSAADTFSRLAKDTNATRYLSNQGVSNNPSWNQVSLANGVTGSLPVNNLAALTASRAIVSDASGFISAATTTSTEIGYVNGVTSGIQAQLNLRPLETFFPQINGFRLTLTSGTAVTTADVTAATTVYLTPYVGAYTALWNTGSALWELLQSAQVSIAVPATTNTNYDVFAYDSSGTLTLENVAWTNATTRATALVMQDGVWCKTGELNKRYVGSFRTTGVSGQTEDSAADRYLFNANNRVRKFLLRQPSTDSWAYDSNTVRQAAGNTANEVEFLIGLSEDIVECTLSTGFIGAGNVGMVGIALDSTSSTATCQIFSGLATVDGDRVPSHAYYAGYPGIGYHSLVWVEATDGGSCTFFGLYTIGAFDIQYGMIGSIWC